MRFCTVWTKSIEHPRKPGSRPCSNPSPPPSSKTASVAFDPARTIDKLGDYAAKAQGAALVVLSEAFVGCYPKGLDFGARVGQRTAAGRDMFRVYHEGAIDVPGPLTERIGEIADDN